MSVCNPNRYVWVDPPSGHRYGFPKVYDTEGGTPMHVWLREQGYLNVDCSIHVWCSPATEEDYLKQERG